MDLRERYLSRGLTPLEEIKNSYHKVNCVDKDGYKYCLCYHGAVGDKRTKSFNKWDKNNPFKPYNMRLYASRVQDDVLILSTDDELRNASIGKVKFVCPNCGKEYNKKWCHWIAQPDNEHFCPQCSNDISCMRRKYSFEEISKIFLEKGFTLLESSKNFDCGGGHTRLKCCDSSGYLYSISLNSLMNGNSGTNKYSTTNPYAIYNFQKWNDDNSTNLVVIKQNKDKRSNFTVKCSCGEFYDVEANQAISLNRIRCPKCTKKESRFELMTRKWLEENNIKFVPQYRFEDCRSKRSLPFDFRCDWNDDIILIEVDGGQHYYLTQWTSEDDLGKQKIRDSIKTEYCKNNGYKLLRIPYWLYDTGSYKNKLKETFFGLD